MAGTKLQCWLCILKKCIEAVRWKQCSFEIFSKVLNNDIREVDVYGVIVKDCVIVIITGCYC